MRNPDEVIGDDYLSRWYLIPKNRLFNIYLHKFTGSDSEYGLHDHPWYSVSFLLKGEVLEHHFNGVNLIPWLFPVFRSAKFAHRLVVVKGPVWTIFVTGPKVREWGFYHKGKWVHWTKATTENGGRKDNE